MKVQLRSGNNPITLKGISFQEAYLLIEVVGDDILGNNSVDLTQLRTTINLQQAGLQASTSFNAVGPAFKHLMDSPNSTSLTDCGWEITTGTTCRGFLRGNTSYLATVKVPILQGGYILRGDDCCDLNIEVLSRLFSDNTSSNSYVYLVTEEANGIVQTDINLPRYEPIDNSRQQVSYSYDGASEIYIINAAPREYDPSTAAFTSVEVRSAYVTDRFDSATIDGLVPTRVASTKAFGSVPLYKVEPNALYDVQINASINTPNVITGAQFIYVNTVISGRTLVARAAAHSAKIQKRNLVKRGL